ncbi:MAG: hypothetical protein EBQ97_07745, partial [Bacteroidetes bacterium]|nr:hypothetical protein [Bacteroidota bacterium]
KEVQNFGKRKTGLWQIPQARKVVFDSLGNIYSLFNIGDSLRLTNGVYRKSDGYNTVLTKINKSNASNAWAYPFKSNDSSMSLIDIVITSNNQITLLVQNSGAGSYRGANYPSNARLFSFNTNGDLLWFKTGFSIQELRTVNQNKIALGYYKSSSDTNFSEIKKADPTKIVGTKKAIIEAVKELKKMEPLIHEYAIPSTHDITDHLIKGTQFGKFTSKSFPNAEQYLKEVGAFEWFIDDDDADHNCYSVSRETMALPTMNLTVLDVRPCGKEKVFDIEVEEINSFLANGIVAHNCMISHGVSRFLTERLFDMSDVFSVPLCANCGAMPHASDICNVCDCTNIRRVLIPYA